jgi:hypothetical protein
MSAHLWVYELKLLNSVVNTVLSTREVLLRANENALDGSRSVLLCVFTAYRQNVQVNSAPVSEGFLIISIKTDAAAFCSIASGVVHHASHLTSPPRPQSTLT